MVFVQDELNPQLRAVSEVKGSVTAYRVCVSLRIVVLLVGISELLAGLMK